MDFSFLKATRFWALIIGALVYYGKTKGFIGEAEMVLVETILGGFVAVRTTDRFSEQLGAGERGEEE
jgi:hypothetical protein